MPMKLERMCSALNSFSGCVMTPISQNCGVEAWKVIFRVLKDTTKTLMPACHFPEKAFPESTTPTEDLVIKPSEWLLPKHEKHRVDSSSKPRESGPSRTGQERSRHRPKTHTPLPTI
uniref:Uncharacterized protein n=1 Tax=Ditylenchus dipsaci TaxID=166011 RepID=A0A915E9N8_9BILA